MSLTLSEAASCPFPGLRPFQAEDAAWFFGREVHIREIIRKLWEFRFVSVVGNSGSGKSSLLRAGVIPHLKSEKASLKVLILRPGHDPVRALAQAILKTGEPTQPISEDEVYSLLQQHEFGLVEAIRLLFPDNGKSFLFLVDQFEEVFRFQQKDFNHTKAQPAAPKAKLF